ncbi:hypothetical protein WA026_001813 [Henosepilachna vigintioctopunctata]|uniref:Uncharacterized protein n=1 Tax=Henosepilachna vigintioctopunctata TaxID=420089 RepID=A0AAW1UT25_9CUCU
MGDSVARLCQKNLLRTPTSHRWEAILADGTSIQIHQAYTMHLNAENISCDIECLHLPKLTSDLILRLDFIETQNLIVKISGTIINLRPQTSDTNRAICSSPVCDLQSEQSTTLELSSTEKTRLENFLEEKLPKFGATK